MEKAKAGVIEDTDTLQVDHFNKRHGYKLGCCRLVSRSYAQSEKQRVAISSTGMVINYVICSEKFESAVGAFVADEQVWPFHCLLKMQLIRNGMKTLGD